MKIWQPNPAISFNIFLLLPFYLTTKEIINYLRDKLENLPVAAI